MTPETAAYLAKARESLDEAKVILTVGLWKPAARCAYYAVFHAAQAFIRERTGRIAKTHSGVRSEFAKVIRDEPAIDERFVASLGQAYKFKEISDYGIGDDAALTETDARDTVVAAEEFVEVVTHVLKTGV